MDDYAKNIKRNMRQLAAEAYQRELHRELTKLDGFFSAWKDGKISSIELSNHIYEIEKLFLQELHKKYNQGKADFHVAYAIVTGILDRSEVPEEILEVLEKHLFLYQSMKDSGDLRLPGE